MLRLATHAMGTRFEIVFPDSGADISRRAVGEECLREVERWHTRLSPYEPASDVSRLHRAAGAWEQIDAELLALLRFCESVRADSGGLFDTAVGALMAAEGFRDEAEPSQAAQTDDTPVLELDEARGRVRLRAGRRLDFGGVGKGWALDRAADILREFGVESALLHGGSSGVVALGKPSPGAGGWAIGLAPGGARTILTDACLAVSAGRGRTAGSKTHLINPRNRTARVLTDASETAALIGPSAAVCDAWTKPVLLIEPDEDGLPRGLCGMLPSGYTAAVHRVETGWRATGPHAIELTGCRASRPMEVA